MDESRRHSFAHVLRARAERTPERLAFSFLSDNGTDEVGFDYARLDRAARRIAVALRAHGLAGGRAVLLFQPGEDYICALAGCWYAGVVAVPVYAPRANDSFERIRLIVADAQAGAILMTSRSVAALQANGWHAGPIQVIATDTLEADPDDWSMPQIGPDTLAVLQYTSGSTGSPKGVRLAHRHLLTNSRMIQNSTGTNEDSVGVFWLPPYHDMGLIGGILQPFYAGFPTRLMAPATFLRRPLLWLDAISRYRGTVSAAPNFAFELCIKRARPEQIAAMDLTRWDMVVNGAEPVRAESMRRFAQTFAPAGFRARTFFPSYGMAETTLFVSGQSFGDHMISLRASREALANGEIVPANAANAVDPSATIEMVACGAPNPEVDVRIVDPQTGEERAPGGVGEIWIHGETVADGYWNREDESERTFRARMVGDERGWLRTGDLGALHEGRLYITGRTKDLIIIRGHNHYPHDIEATVLLAHPAIRPGGAAAFAMDADADGAEALGLVVEIDRGWNGEGGEAGLEAVAQAVRDAVSRQHQLQIERLAFVRANSIPKTSSGKVQRYLARQHLLTGKMTEIDKDVLDATAIAS
jgi:acyl-CoA synthetase (AMP-forming)/AMP-acid ligase II